MKSEDDLTKTAWKTLDAFVRQQATKAATPEHVAWNEARTALIHTVKSKEAVKQDVGEPANIVGKICAFGSRDCVWSKILRICQHRVSRVLNGSNIQLMGNHGLRAPKERRSRSRCNPTRFISKEEEIFQMS